jgi:hypothetical protein
MAGLRRELMVLSAWIAAGAVIVVVVGLVVVPFVWSFTTPAPPGCAACGAPPFSIRATGGPSSCATHIDAPGCLSAGDYVYTLGIATSDSVPFGGFYLRVVTASGLNYTAPTNGGFFVLNATGQLVAAFNLTRGGSLSMTGPAEWTYLTASTGVSAASALTPFDTIAVNVGTNDTAGQGCQAIALVPAASGGSTAVVDLP